MLPEINIEITCSLPSFEFTPASFTQSSVIPSIPYRTPARPLPPLDSGNKLLPDYGGRIVVTTTTSPHRPNYPISMHARKMPRCVASNMHAAHFARLIHVHQRGQAIEAEHSLPHAPHRS
ncbi:hypothetical protein RB195_002978 [Necator americanus]|uniref:Uncharacterized protein n=1 Tax=Necator americanus TaxID=51031 RepID=A0ABR1DLP3_NECAM